MDTFQFSSRKSLPATLVGDHFIAPFTSSSHFRLSRQALRGYLEHDLAVAPRLPNVTPALKPKWREKIHHVVLRRASVQEAPNRPLLRSFNRLATGWRLACCPCQLSELKFSAWLLNLYVTSQISYLEEYRMEICRLKSWVWPLF